VYANGQPLLDFLEIHAITICDSQGLTVPTAHLTTMRALHEGQPIINYQETIHHADGTKLAVLATAMPFTDPELLTGFAAMIGNGQTKASEPAALVVFLGQKYTLRDFSAYPGPPTPTENRNLWENPSFRYGVPFNAIQAPRESM
jgi:hypothetical protein